VNAVHVGVIAVAAAVGALTAIAVERFLSRK
jgi:hypothetical protein